MYVFLSILFAYKTVELLRFLLEDGKNNDSKCKVRVCLCTFIFWDAGLGRIAGIVSLEVGDGNASLDVLHRVGPELAMHVVAAKPLFLTRELVPSEAMESEREVLKSQVHYESFGHFHFGIEYCLFIYLSWKLFNRLSISVLI